MARKKAKVYDLTSETEQELEQEQEQEQEQETRRKERNMAVIQKGLVESYLSFTPDELISGSAQGFGEYVVALRTAGEYKRGELLMVNGNQYVKATSEGIASADSLVILAENVTVTGEDAYAEAAAYSSGKFKASAVILPYEGENDDHDELIAALKPVLMQMKIYLE